MKSNRRLREPLMTADRIGEIFDAMREKIFPDGITPLKFKKFLYAVQNVERRSIKEGQAGRPPRFERELLVSAAAKLRQILEDATGKRVSLLSFIANCLPALDYPPDVQYALDNWKINLDEARTLARINARGLGASEQKSASEIRGELLATHLRRGGTQMELRQRVNDRLGTTAKAQASVVSYQVAVLDEAVDELIEFDESDTSHLLWEDIKGLVFLAREINFDSMNEDAVDEVREDLEKITAKLLKFKTPSAVKWWETR